MFLMLNPSTATHEVLDPTVTRCVKFAKAWGYGGVEVCNIFALRATDPKVMKADDAPVGIDNDRYIKEVAKLVAIRGGHVVCAWGQHGLHQGRGDKVKGFLRSLCIPLYFLRMGANGQPWHPLYLPSSSTPIAWDF